MQSLKPHWLIMKMRHDVSLFPKVLLPVHDILKVERTGKWLGRVTHWSGHSNSEHANTGQHIDPTQEKRPPAGYDMQLKVERSLRNIIMMFVTADDSAWVANKRGASGFGPNGAEEWLREVMVVVVVVVREGGLEAGFLYIGCYTEPASAGYGVGVWWEKVRVGRQNPSWWPYYMNIC